MVAVKKTNLNKQIAKQTKVPKQKTAKLKARGRRSAKEQKANQQSKKKAEPPKTKQLKLKQQNNRKQQQEAKLCETKLKEPSVQEATQVTADPTPGAKPRTTVSAFDLEDEKRRNHIGCVLVPTLQEIAAATGLNILSEDMRNSKHDVGFCSEKCPKGSLENPLHTHWKGALGNRSYYCPSGWYRFSLDVDSVARSYPTWEQWTTMYHGTTAAAINSILNPVHPGKFKKNNGYCGVAAYFSPSIRYVAFPGYSYVSSTEEEGHPVYYQLALEVRVDTTRANLRTNKETVKYGYGPIDVNHDDSTFQYIVALLGSDPFVDYVNASDGVIVTGLMVRKLRVHPKELDECKWIYDDDWSTYGVPRPISVPRG